MEKWAERRDTMKIVSHIFSSKPDAATRTEVVSVLYTIYDNGVRKRPQYLSEFPMRTYSAKELFRTLDSVNDVFEVASLHGFEYDIDLESDPREDESLRAVMVVLRRL